MKINRLAQRLLVVSLLVASGSACGAGPTAMNVGSSADTAPELGTADVPAELQEALGGKTGRKVSTADQLGVKSSAANGKELISLGRVEEDGSYCTYTYLDGLPSAFSGTCSGRAAWDAEGPLDTLRSSHGDVQAISGFAPRGTRTVQLLDLGTRQSTVVRAFRAGGQRGDRGYFITPWPGASKTELRAFSSSGKLLARWESAPFVASTESN